MLTTLAGIRHASPNLYTDLVLTRHTQSATISLPLAGEVDLWVFQPKAFPPGENVVEMVEEAVRATEGFIGAPFPTTQVILLIPIIGPETDHGIGGGGHWGRFITVTRYETQPWPIRGGIYHEVGHYYFGGGIGPPWLVEGGAEFMFSYTSVQAGVMSPEEQELTHLNWVEAGCLDQGMRNIQELNERQRASDSFIHCNYNLGGFFLLKMFETLGEEAMGGCDTRVVPAVNVGAASGDRGGDLPDVTQAHSRPPAREVPNYVQAMARRVVRRRSGLSRRRQRHALLPQAVSPGLRAAR